MPVEKVSLHNRDAPEALVAAAMVILPLSGSLPVIQVPGKLSSK